MKRVIITFTTLLFLFASAWAEESISITGEALGTYVQGKSKTFELEYSCKSITLNISLETTLKSKTCKMKMWEKVDGNWVNERTIDGINKKATNFTYEINPLATEIKLRNELTYVKTVNSITLTKSTSEIPTDECEEFRDLTEYRMEAYLIGKNKEYDFGKEVYKSTLSFVAKCSDLSLLNTDLYAKVGGEWQMIWDESESGISSSYKKFSVALPDGTTAIRFYNNVGSSCWRNYLNVIVTKRCNEEEEEDVETAAAKTDDDKKFPTLSEAIEHAKEIGGGITILTDREIENIKLETGTKISVNGQGHKIGDVTVESGAKLTVSGALITGNVNMKTIYRNSAEIDPLDGNLQVSGRVSFDKELDPSGTVDNSLWYAVCVPFPVEMNDIYAIGVEGEEIPLTYGVNLLFDRYDGAKRAATGKGWRRMAESETLIPGQMYILLSDYNNLRFYMKEGEVLTSGLTTLELQEYQADSSVNQGWNAIGNSQMYHVKMSTESEFGQVLVQGTKAFDLVDLSTESFSVASPLFIQYHDGSKAVNLTKTSDGSLRSAISGNDMFNLQISAIEGGAQDQIFIRASETASKVYETGKDLAKMGVLEDVSMARLWMEAKSEKLCVINAPLLNGEAQIPLGIYAPKAGTYNLNLSKVADGLRLELLYNGEVVNDFADGDYALTLNEGVASGYSLRVSTESLIPTYVAETDGVSAYISDGVLTIAGLNEGEPFHIYNIGGMTGAGISDGNVQKINLSDEGLVIVVCRESAMKLMNIK